MILYQALDQIITLAAQDQATLLRARQSWGEQAGEVHDDEALYEERATAFLEWLALDFVPAPDRPPAVVALLEASEAAARAPLVALASSHRSVFRVDHLVDEGVVLEDIWGGAMFFVHERRQLGGLDPGELFEARLAPDPETPPNLVFTRAFCFHPREALPAVRELVEASHLAGASRESLCFKLLRLRVRWERYRHVDPARVYLTGRP